MEHVRIATYEINKGSFEEVADAAKTGMLRKFQETPGFIRYGVADLGDKKCVSISLWETRDEATAAAPLAESWVRENLSDRITLRSNYIGTLAFFQGAPATV